MYLHMILKGPNNMEWREYEIIDEYSTNMWFIFSRENDGANGMLQTSNKNSSAKFVKN